MIHNLKCLPAYYQWLIAPLSMRKTVEIRLDDRNYTSGDLLMLHEYNPADDTYTGRSCCRLVTHCLREQPFVPAGYVAMSICEPAADRSAAISMGAHNDQRGATIMVSGDVSGGRREDR